MPKGKKLVETPSAAIARGVAALREIAALEQTAGGEAAALYRRTITRRDPLLFALIYFPRHLTDPATGRISLAPAHVEWARTAREWRKTPEPGRGRRAEVAPRDMGKSTWHFLILPLWAAAHGHRRFAAAFADSGTQAETHLATFKAELDGNRLIRFDYPDLVEPKTRGRGQVAADRVSLYHAKSGFVFAAAGMDSSNLGLKVGDRRPDLIILDDIEPHEGRYSKDLAERRLNTLRETIFPLNVRARVIIVGTVTMHGSIIHQIVRRAAGDDPDDAFSWVDDERIRARRIAPIVERDGVRASVWPEKWSLEYLDSISHTRQYAKNYENDPLGADGDYWTLSDFVKLTPELDAAVGHEVISIDPAVTSKDSSDYTAISAVGFARTVKRCAVYEARAVKKPAPEIRELVVAMAERAMLRGHHVLVIIETNQGGDLWKDRVLHDLPFRVKTFTVSDPKPVRAADALDHYQRGRVEHAPGLRDAEGQMVAYPRAPNDDLVDSIGAGVRYFLSPKRKTKAGAVTAAYA